MNRIKSFSHFCAPRKKGGDCFSPEKSAGFRKERSFAMISQLKKDIISSVRHRHDEGDG
jgi:ABC-type Fe3+-citrate transport system substrate-binding protein